MDLQNENQILFEEILDVWLEDIRQTHAISTYVKYTRIARKHVQPYFKDVPLEQVTPTHLREFSNYLKQFMQESKENTKFLNKVSKEKSTDFSMEDIYSYTIVQNAVMITNMAMKMAFRQGFIHEWNAVPCSRRKKRTLVQVFSAEEQTKLEGYIKENWSQTGFGIYLCLYTGMRLGEICALKWENINIREGYLTICATVQRLSVEQEDGNRKSMLFVTPPKSDTSVRKIPFPSFLTPFLEKISKTAKKDSFLLKSKSQAPMDPRTFQYQYKRFLNQAGVPYYNFHTLRHTFATRCITSGMDPKTLSEILGHADIKITMDYYFHSSFEFKKNQMEKLAALA